jgi:N-acetylmuramoyl-L-alanine amidase
MGTRVIAMIARHLRVPLLLCLLGSASLVPSAAQEAEGTGAALTRTATLATCNRAHFAVALDVGHTPETPGAMSARGVPEFAFNLMLAERIERALREAGFDKTRLLITDGKAKPSLFMRVAHAADVDADLFLSIHHDAVPKQFKEKWEFEGRELEYSDRFTGHSIFVSSDHASYKASLAFARQLGLQMKARGLAYTPHYTEAFMGPRRRQLVDAEAGVYRFDELVVLRRTSMPAVLLEGGMIVNRNDEPRLASPEHQALVAAAVVDAVERFCAAQAPTEVSALRRPKPAPKTRSPVLAGSSRKVTLPTPPALPGRD